ncbi:asparagine synthase (glutamine-hydrolyzing) [Pseudodesulfovibrio portus]|uniref:asparagine synthase (glutamine-hydrolyzing) n=1 Tax=Pseudodesulfovibrio portus TaxID=231439 RepID=A0ABM8ATD2_9BACT|nr:asparagine synthase (glutamine-hydrolyzing) [Pseudodesulfovibrio portus]BDQ34719.1 asparagine synthetase B [Pseudodesulfovibrio portus]
MCGIFGVIGHIDPGRAAACRDLMAHRGPDGAGLWTGDGVTLGHRRLSILDLSDRGGQPMAYADGRYRIVYNGELYNFVEVRAELEARGETFVSDSDTEVLLAAYAVWGPDCMDRFNGMWALAIWDDAERTLFLARDRFGKKPLFYARTGCGFVFASEMKAIMPLMDTIEPHDELTRSSRRIMHYESTDECLIKGISRFPAGHFGVLRDGELRLTRWWNTLDHVMDVPDSFEERAELFREIFLDACRIRMRSDVPIGCALSGGLDSSSVICSVAHVARHASGSRISSDFQHAFNAGFPGTPQDETPYARRVADHLGIPLTTLTVDPLASVNELYSQLYLFEEMHLTMPLPFMLTYGAIREGGVTVTLDGHGTDECFAGYLFTAKEALADAGCNIRAARGVLDAFYYGRPQSTQFPATPRWKFVLDFHLQRLSRALKGAGGVSCRDSGHPRWKELDHLTRILYVATHESILPTLLRNYDRYSMANGVEIRMPFMDHRIVTLAFSLAWDDKVRDGYTKAVVRRGVDGIVPPDITWRRTKIGFNSPVVDWMKGPLKEFFLDEVHSQAFGQSALVDRELARTRLEGVIADPDATYAQGEAAWTALLPYFWEQAMLKGRR